MKISAKSRYGLLAVVELARTSDEMLVASKVIAEKHGISEGYLEQIFSALKKAGIVKSMKGSQGGYGLAKPASEISIESVLIALEGKLEIVERTNDSTGDTAVLDKCLNEFLWNPIDHMIFSYIKALTVEVLSTEYVNRLKADEPMYYI